MESQRGFHSVRIDSGAGTTIDLEWDLGRSGTQQPPPERSSILSCTTEISPDNLWNRGVPAIGWRGEEDSLFEPLQVREGSEYLVDVRIPMAKQLAVGEWMENRCFPFSKRISKHYRSDPPRRWKDEDGLLLVPGRLRTRNHIGILDLSLPMGHPVLLEVLSTKIGYREDLRAFLDAISAEIVELLVELDASTFIMLSSNVNVSASPMSELLHMRRLMRDDLLPVAVELITQSPHTMILETTQQVPIGRVSRTVRRLDTHAMDLSRTREGGALAGLFRGRTPELIPENTKSEVLDTPENRYVKAFLEELLDKAEKLKEELDNIQKPHSSDEAARWASVISDWLSRPIWREIGPLTMIPTNSQVLLRREGYRNILEADISLQLGLRLPWKRGESISDGILADFRPISELYEYWCFLVLRRCLRGICSPEDPPASSLLQRDKGGLSLQLARGRESEERFVFHPQSVSSLNISLFYNRSFESLESDDVWSGSYTSRFLPDFSLHITPEIEGKFGGQSHWLHFDAKYRVDPQAWHLLSGGPIAELEEELTVRDPNEDSVPYKKQDLYKMHTYRDALLGTRGSYVLFPGAEDTEEVFIRLPGETYPASPLLMPSVGAFQLAPNSHSNQIDALAAFLEKVLKQISQRDIYIEEYGFGPRSYEDDPQW